MDDIAYWLALQRVPGLGPVTCRELLNRYGDARRLFASAPHDPALDGRLAPRLRAALLAPDWRQAEKDLRWLAPPDHHALPLTSPAYPPLLRETRDAPILLFVRGNADALTDMQIAVVGSRNPSPGGRDNAFDFALALSSAGLTITSGMAVGIDGAAHRGAIAARGRTIAVAGTGLDIIYPARHRQLARDILEHGALVSEYPPGSPPLPSSFPRRNRIISGLSLGTLVVEAAPGSGSLITARAALEQGREVFAIPGSIHNPLARGCHQLLRLGAKLVENTTDILEELTPLAGAAAALRNRSDEQPPVDPQAAVILKLLEYEVGVTLDTLSERSGLSAEHLHRILLDLELETRITVGPGGTFLRRRPPPDPRC
jgi:DNA processing protein